MSGTKKILILLFLSVFLCLPHFADETKDSDEQKKEKKSVIHPHEEVVVTATMTRRMVKDCSASVSVVNADDIQAIPASNALNLLENFPGIYVRRTGYFGRADIDIRGIGQRGRRIAVLVDGRPEKMGLFGCTVTHTFPLDNVERIEVVRGASSVLYGSEALGGVVNIMTHMPEEKFETDFTASYGSFDTRQFNFRHGGNLGKLSYFFTLDRRSSNGHRENAGYEGNALTGKVEYQWTEKMNMSLQMKYFDGRKYEAGPLDHPLTDFWNDYERGAVDFSFQRQGEKDEVLLKLYRNFGHHQFSDGWHSRDYVDGGVVRYTSRRIANNELTLGADFRLLGGKSYNFPRGSWEKNEQAVFFRDQYVLWEKWILSGGVRLHRDSLYGLEVAPHWGLVYQLNDSTSLRGTINKGFRSPQLNEIFMFPAANKNLEPERVWNFEVGFSEQLAPWLNLDGAYYYMKGSNLIEMSQNPSPPPFYQFMNTGEFVFQGGEFSLQAKIAPNISGLLFYTYLDPGNKTKGRPGHKLDFSFRLREKSFYASLQAQYVTDYYAGDFATRALPSYFRLNSRLSYKLSSHLEVFLEMNNLFNQKYNIYVSIPGVASGVYPMPQRNLNLGIKIKQ
ncbi:TonB-dependent receptor [bacterium]|nr:TonB-dependent receptor [bacterium]